MKTHRRAGKLKTVLSILWFVFTFSMVAWWWLFFLNKLDPDQQLALEYLHKSHRMFAWEGSILLTAILLGGISLIIFSYRDQRRHQRLSFFFSTFSHDIKTSIARLRLQAEVLEEDPAANHPVMKRLIQDIQRLDLQLENSLFLSTLESGSFLEEKISLKDIMIHLRADFSELSVELEKEAWIVGDRRALISVFKNLIQNSVLHGQATLVRIQIKKLNSSQLQLTISDNGLGFKGDRHKLGSELLNSKNSHSNGIGLYISKRLVEKMRGRMTFEPSSEGGFTVLLKIRGRLHE